MSCCWSPETGISTSCSGPSWGRGRLWWGHPAAFSSPGSTTKQPQLPLVRSLQTSLHLGHSLVVWCPLCIGAPKTRLKWSPFSTAKSWTVTSPSTGWWCCAWCTPDTAGPSGCQGTLLTSTQILHISFHRAALHLLVWPCNQDYHILGENSWLTLVKVHVVGDCSALSGSLYKALKEDHRSQHSIISKFISSTFNFCTNIIYEDIKESPPLTAHQPDNPIYCTLCTWPISSLLT